MIFLSLDLSLGNSGGCVFENGKPVRIFSIPTNPKEEHKDRLRTIGDFLESIKNNYVIEKIVLENGFSRFNASTQAVYKVIGVASYIFSGLDQIFYPPSTIKKTITGNGRSDKNEVANVVKRLYPDVIFDNNDETDACAAGVCYLIKTHSMKLE